MVDNTTDYRVAINVKSKLSPSELLYLVEEDFQHPILTKLAELPTGWTSAASQPDGFALDFIRGNLFKQEDMKPLPHDLPGPDNDLNEKINAIVARAMADEEAHVYALGELWGPEQQKKDKYFGFLPGNGIHDIHMNQGNRGRFAKDNGVWQDGGLLFHFPEIMNPHSGDVVFPEQWAAIFLAFQSQSWHTDDVTGHALDAPPPVVTPGEGPTIIPGDRDGHLRIVAALANPPGHDPGGETVTLLNASPAAVDLAGWAIVDAKKRKTILAGSASLGPGETVRVVLDGTGAVLSNKGGLISLLDPAGIKVDGVSYTKAAARRQGWTLVF